MVHLHLTINTLGSIHHWVNFVTHKQDTLLAR